MTAATSRGTTNDGLPLESAVVIPDLDGIKSRDVLWMSKHADKDMAITRISLKNGEFFGIEDNTIPDFPIEIEVFS